MFQDLKNRSIFNKKEVHSSKKQLSVVLSRNFRFRANFLFYFAIELANKFDMKIEVLLAPCPELFPTMRHVEFLRPILSELTQELKEAGIVVSAFTNLSYEDNFLKMMAYLNDMSGLVLADYHTMPQASEKIMSLLDLNCYVAIIEALNIYPCWSISDHKEYSAATFRHKLKPHTLALEMAKVPEYSSLIQPTKCSFNTDEIISYLTRYCDTAVLPIYCDSTKHKADQELAEFIDTKLAYYAKLKNDPLAECTSKMSKWLAYGVLSPQIIGSAVLNSPGNDLAKDMYLEELICRRELAENFVYYACPDHFSSTNFYSWTTNTLKAHMSDERQVILSRHELEYGFSPNQLWNAIQINLLQSGEMHGYVRMYWAKTVLKWTSDPFSAAEWVLYFNNKYAIDGSTPNSSVGVLWAMRGLHDRAFGERPIFGKIRYMSETALKKHFDIQEYMMQLKDTNSV